MTGIIVFGLLLQAFVFPFSRAAAMLPGVLAALVMLIVSLGKATTGLKFSFFGIHLHPFIGLALALLWLAWSLATLLRVEKGRVQHTFMEIVRGFGKTLLLCTTVVLSMAVIVFPTVLLATGIPTVFAIGTISGILALMVFLLVRKYRTMVLLDIADTRTRSRENWPGLWMRWLFRTSVRPFLAVVACLAYVYVLALVGVAPLAGGVLLVSLTLAIMWMARILRALPWMGGRD